MGTAHVPEWLARASYPTLSYYAQQQYGGAAAYAAEIMQPLRRPSKAETGGVSQEAPPVIQARKRHLNSSSASSAGSSIVSARAPLTQDNLLQLTRTAGGSGRTQSGSMDSSRSAVSDADSGPGESAFESASGRALFRSLLLANGVLDSRTSLPPTNLATHRACLDRKRRSPSPPVSAFEEYVDEVTRARRHGDRQGKPRVLRESLCLLNGSSNDLNYTWALGRRFTDFPRDVGFNDGLCRPRPDFLEGADWEEFDPYPLYHLIGGAAVPDREDPDAAALPHLAGEVRGPDEEAAHVRARAAFDGAALVYARNRALDALSASDPRDHAVTTTFITDGDVIHFFANYAVPAPVKATTAHAATPTSHTASSATSPRPPPPSERIEYHQYPIASTHMTRSFEEWKLGRRQLRNAQEDARRHGIRLRDRIVGDWQAQQVLDDFSFQAGLLRRYPGCHGHGHRSHRRRRCTNTQSVI